MAALARHQDARLDTQLDFYRELRSRYGTSPLAGADALEATEDALSVAVQRVDEHVHVFSAGNWRRLLRAAPYEAFGTDRLRRPGSLAERRHIAEALSSRSPTSADDLDPWPLRADQLEAFAAFVSWAREVGQLRVMRRSVCQDAPIRIGRDRLDVVQGSAEFGYLQWIDRYIEAFPAGMNLNFGTLASGLGESEIWDPGMVVMVAGEFSAGWRRRPAAFQLFRDDWRAPNLLRQRAWYREDLPAALVALKVIIFNLVASGTIEQATKRGLVYSPRGAFEEVLASCSSGADRIERIVAPFLGFDRSVLEVGALWQLLERLPWTSEFHGGAVVLDLPHDGVVVDLDMLSRLVWWLTAPRETGGGDAVNNRAKDLERVTQEAIDQTAARPPDQVRELVGRTLRDPGGDAVTDIDAAMFIDDTLYLVNCKSFVPAGLLEKEFRAIRTFNDRLRDGLADWRNQVSRLRAAPVGANFDLGAYPRIEAALLIPAPYFIRRELQREAATSTVPAILSLPELTSLLEGGKTRWELSPTPGP
jgi:hypothetical protein